MISIQPLKALQNQKLGGLIFLVVVIGKVFVFHQAVG